MTAPRTLLHLIRHADAIPEANGPVSTGGYEDLPLSARGVAQAAALAERIASGGARPVAIYASPTLRAHETGLAIARAMKLDVVPDQRLREIYLGAEPATTLAPDARAAAVRARLEELAAIALRDGSWAAVPDCEPGSEVRARMRAAVADIVARHEGEHIALVSHAGSINAYLADVLGLTRDFVFPIGNTSLSTVRFSEHPPMVVRINDTAHLESLGARP